MTVSEIINALGGISAATKILKVKYPSVVQGWIARNKIPDWRIDDVNRAAKENGLPFRVLTPDKSSEINSEISSEQVCGEEIFSEPELTREN